MEHLKKRVDEIFCEVDKELIFRNPKHRNDFYSLLMGKRAKTLQYAPGYAAAEILWEKVRKNVLDTGIYFDRVRLSVAKERPASRAGVCVTCLVVA